MILSVDGRYVTAAEKKYQTDRYRCMYNNTAIMAIHGGFRKRGPGFLYTLFGWGGKGGVWMVRTDGVFVRRAFNTLV